MNIKISKNCKTHSRSIFAGTAFMEHIYEEEVLFTSMIIYGSCRCQLTKNQIKPNRVHIIAT